MIARPVVLVLVLLALLSLLPPQEAKAHDSLRVLCVESGPYTEYQHILFGLATGLSKIGLIQKKPPLALKDVEGRSIWRWMGKHAHESLTFLADGYYSNEWDENARGRVRETVRRRLEQRKDVDLIITLGTRSSQDIASLPTEVPILVLGVTDAVNAGIIKSADDSGQDHLMALVDTERFRRQIQVFHLTFPFRRLGVVYEDSPTGRSTVALQEIEAACAALGVELVPCHTPLFDRNPDVVADKVAHCHRTLLSKQVDAVYVTYSVSLDHAQTQRLLAPLVNACIPTFSQEGVDAVHNGVLLSFVDGGQEEGRAAVTALESILHGIPPRALPQRFVSPSLLAINLRTAALMGWNPPLEVLLSVDQFYGD